MQYSITISVFSLAVAAALLAGCGKKNTPVPLGADDSASSQITEVPLPEQGLILVQVDLNVDKQPDIFNYYRERANAPRLLVRKEVDLNFDSKIDVISFYDATGSLERENMDSDFDGSFDTTDFYKDGRRVSSERDTNFDGRPDVFTSYQRASDGIDHPTEQQRDTDHEPGIDMWLKFDADGNVVRIGRDTDGDGTMDTRDE